MGYWCGVVMNDLILTLLSRLISMPMVADVVYGPAGRFVFGLWNRLRWALTAASPARIERFGRNYFRPRSSLIMWVTNVCNARCGFCAYPQIAATANRITGAMPMDIFCKTVDDYVAAGGVHVDMTPTVGDPLLDPTFIEKVRYCRQKAGVPGVSMTTNAIAILRNETYKHLIDAGVTFLAISLPDVEREIYQQVYGVDRGQEVLRGIKALLDYNKAKGEPVRIVLRFRNARKPSAIIRSREFQEHVRPYLSRKVTSNFTLDFDNWGGSITPDLLQGVMKLRPIPRPHRVPCMSLVALIVQHDGDVRLCGCRLKKTEKDELVVGNIKKNTLTEIGQSDAVHRIYEGFYAGERPEVCQQCSLYRPMSRTWIDQMWPKAARGVASE